MSHGATGRKSPSGGVEAQRGGGGGGRGGCRWDQAGARPRGARGVGSKVERQWETAGLEGHRAGHPEALLFVGLKHVGEAEALAAHLAGVGFLSRVGAAVALHVGPAGEALPADLTDERLLS